jgi:hypothetical protein
VQQYDLTGQLVEDGSTEVVEAPAMPARPPVQLDLGVRQLVPVVTRSARWRGQVVSESLDMVLASSTSEPGPDMTPDDHGRPGYLGPIGPHRCPGPSTCEQRWLTDDELEG